jgi:hypothetical protein
MIHSKLLQVFILPIRSLEKLYSATFYNKVKKSRYLDIKQIKFQTGKDMNTISLRPELFL